MKKTKILLVRYLEEGNINARLPTSVYKAQGVYPPLGIAYLAAVLEKEGYKVSILDVPALNLTSSEAKNEIFKAKADVVGITCMTSNFKGALEAAKFAKESGAIVVLGGPQLSAYPKESISYSFVDYGINGESEYSLLKLINLIEANKIERFKQRKFQLELKKIEGLIFKENQSSKKNKEKIFANPPAIVKNLDELPLPAIHLLPVDKYDCIITEKPVLTMITSRGCPFQCGFCFKQNSDKYFRMRSPKKVVDEIEILINKYKIKELMFYDDTLTMNREHIVDICNEIIKRGIKIKWQSPTRIDMIDKELLILMKKAGCRMLRYGVESGDENILKIMKKNISLDRVRQVFKWTREAGIETFAYFIIGYIGESEETMKKTIKFAKELNPDMVMFTIATPYPKTNLYELAEKAGYVKGDYWQNFVSGKTDERLKYFVNDAEKWAKRAYFEFYFRPSFIFRKILKINSIDTLKKYFKGALAIFHMDS